VDGESLTGHGSTGKFIIKHTGQVYCKCLLIRCLCTSIKEKTAYSLHLSFSFPKTALAQLGSFNIRIQVKDVPASISMHFVLAMIRIMLDASLRFPRRRKESKKRADTSSSNGKSKNKKANTANTSSDKDNVEVMLADMFKPDTHNLTGYYLSEKLDRMHCVWDGADTWWTHNGNVIPVPK